MMRLTKEQLDYFNARRIRVALKRMEADRGRDALDAMIEAGYFETRVRFDHDRDWLDIDENLKWRPGWLRAQTGMKGA